MKYQVNLFSPEELRSGAPVSKKFLIRLAVAVVIGLFVLGIAALVASVKLKQSNLQELKAQWATLSKNRQKVEDIEKDQKKIAPLASDAEGWRISRFDWSAAFADLPAMVPETMQLTRLDVRGECDATPSRRFTMTLDGTVGGEFPERDLRILQENLKNSSAFKDVLAGVEVRRYDPDPDKNSDLKIFKIQCTFKPRPIKP